jgi:hypothetical protein
MDRLHDYWKWVADHRVDLVVAAAFALVFAVIIGVMIELVGLGALIRNAVRHFKNKQSERSATRLRERIKLLEAQRDRYTAYLTSDKALYLATFRIVIGILMFMATGAGIMAFDEVIPVPRVGLVGIFCYFIAFIIGAQGFTISSLDTREKVSQMITKLEAEIADLKNKLEAIAK